MQTEYLTFIADFKVQGRFAYLSHQETLSFWRRVLVRAQLPLIYSQGFNPHPRLSLALPRTVGVRSDCERLCALMAAEGFCGQSARRRIDPLLTDDCVLIATDTAPGKVSFYPVSATYQLTLVQRPDAPRQSHLESCMTQARTSEPIMLMRHMEKNRQRSIDIRPFLEDVCQSGRIVQVRCAIRPQGTVRVDELMRWLAIEPSDLAEPVRRIAVRRVTNPKHWQGEEYPS